MSLKPVMMVTVMTALSACGAQPSATEVPVSVLYRSNLCGESVATMRLVRNQKDLYALFGQISPAVNATPVTPFVDFKTTQVLMVALGQQPTPGYALDYREGQFRLEEGRLELLLDVTRPVPGALLAQMISSPCVVLAVPRDLALRTRVFADDPQFPLGVSNPDP